MSSKRLQLHKDGYHYLLITIKRKNKGVCVEGGTTGVEMCGGGEGGGGWTIGGKNKRGCGGVEYRGFPLVLNAP